MKFEYTFHNDKHISLQISQEAYAAEAVSTMGLSNATCSPMMSPYRLGLPIDSIPKLMMSKAKREPLLELYLT